MSRATMIRRVRGVVALLAGAFVACGANAAHAAPSVAMTLYAPTVSGNIGASTSGVSVIVKLVRNGQTVATSPAASTDAGGAWTATLPEHAPSDARDAVEWITRVPGRRRERAVRAQQP